MNQPLFPTSCNLRAESARVGRNVTNENKFWPFSPAITEAIAEAMDCPVGTVRSRIFRAREAIDNKLNPLLAHGDF